MHFSSLRCFSLIRYVIYVTAELTWMRERERERGSAPWGCCGGCINIVRDSPGVSFRNLLPWYDTDCWQFIVCTSRGSWSVSALTSSWVWNARVLSCTQLSTFLASTAFNIYLFHDFCRIFEHSFRIQSLTPRNVVVLYRCFGGKCCFCLQGKRNLVQVGNRETYQFILFIPCIFSVSYISLTD